MKNILVPTDFSACADHAIDLGFAFAEFFDAKLHLFTSIENLPGDWEEMTEVEKNKLPESLQLEKNVNELLQKFRKRAERDGIRLNTTISSGKFLRGLQRQVDRFQIDFVVMGSHGASGKNEFFIGSNTQKAVRKLHVPVFVIKNPIKKYAFKNVVFASNFDANEKEAFLKFLDFIKWFTPETIHLLAVNTSDWFSQPSFLMKEAMKDFKALCGDINCKTHFYRDISVDAGVRHFTAEVNADLVVISNHHRHPLKRIFQGSSVEAVVNHSSVPVLSIDFKEELVVIDS